MPAPPAPTKEKASDKMTLNSRTFVRNIIPYSYPPGIRPGFDWNLPGDVYDNTDKRNPTYWGPPLPIAGDKDFAPKAGETRPNTIRRLKIAGFVGLYCTRAEAERRSGQTKPEEDEEQPLIRQTSFTQIAENVRARRNGTAPRNLDPEDGTKPSRTDARTTERAGGKGKGAKQPAPAMVNNGDGYKDNGVPPEIPVADAAAADVRGFENVAGEPRPVAPPVTPPGPETTEPTLQETVTPSATEGTPGAENTADAPDAPVGGHVTVAEPEDKPGPPSTLKAKRLGGGGRQPVAPAADDEGDEGEEGLGDE